MAGMVILLVGIALGLVSGIANAIDGNPVALWITLPGAGLALLLIGFFGQILHHQKMLRLQLSDMEADLEAVAQARKSAGL